ncbi:MAG: hypothetical protein DI558_08080 [Corynebacterium propinquum]|nr:MAG: hypothetical protein DI558_08080 [Corynebacterium propinquum]
MPDSDLKFQLAGFVAREIMAREFVARELTAMFAGARWIIRPRALDSVGSRKYTEAYNARVAHCAMISRVRVQKAI